MTTEFTIQISGSRTVGVTNLADLSTALQTLTDANEGDSTVKVASGALRWRDGGVWVQASLETPTAAGAIEVKRTELAQLAYDVGVVDSVADGEEQATVNA